MSLSFNILIFVVGDSLYNMNTFVSFIVAPSTSLLELLVYVEFVGIGVKARLTEDDTQWLQRCDAVNGFEVDFLVETSHHRPFVHDVQMFVFHLFTAERIAQLHAPVHHTTKEQIQLRAVGLDVIYLFEEVRSVQSARLEVHFLHIGRVDPQHTETGV